MTSNSNPGHRLKFASELMCNCVSKCRSRLIESYDEISSDELLFGCISNGTITGCSSDACLQLFDSRNGRNLGELAIRNCTAKSAGATTASIQRYMAINLNGATYETVTFELGDTDPWKAEFYCEGRLVGSIVELPWPERGWFRKFLMIRNFPRTFEIFFDDGNKFAQFSHEGSVSSRTVFQLEISGTSTRISVALADSLFQRKSTYAIIGTEIDAMRDKSKQLCFATAMWIRFQMYQMMFGPSYS